MIKRIIEWDEVVERLGPSILGTTKIDKLTTRQEWLLDPELAGKLTDQAIGKTPGFVNYFAGNLDQSVDLKVDTADPEYRETVKQRNFIEWQWAKIDAWLDRRGIATTEHGVDGEAFEAAYAQAFPSQLPRWNIQQDILPSVSRLGCKPATNDVIATWATAKQNELKARGEKHGRDRIIPLTAKNFGVKQYVVRHAWRPGRGVTPQKAK